MAGGGNLGVKFRPFHASFFYMCGRGRRKGLQIFWCGSDRVMSDQRRLDAHRIIL